MVISTRNITAVTSDPVQRGIPENNVGNIIMATGAVKWFNSEKSFGFIEQDGGGADVFAHHSNIRFEGYRDLAEGPTVEFDATQGPKGLQGENIVLI